MKRSKITACALLVVIVGQGAFAGTGEDHVAKRVAMATVSALCLEGDKDAALQFFHPEAQRKSHGKGSALKLPDEDFRKFHIREIIFFGEGDVPDLNRRFPDDMWDTDRVGAAVRQGTGCLVVVSMEGKKGNGLLCLVVKEIDGKQQIVYVDDN